MVMTLKYTANTVNLTSTSSWNILNDAEGEDTTSMSSYSNDDIIDASLFFNIQFDAAATGHVEVWVGWGTSSSTDYVLAGTIGSDKVDSNNRTSKSLPFPLSDSFNTAYKTLHLKIVNKSGATLGVVYESDLHFRSYTMADI